MIVVITGGAGFIGSHLARLHREKDDTVYTIDNCITGSTHNIEQLMEHSSFHFIKKDVCTYSYEDLPQANIVYNLASPASPIQYKKYPIQTLRTNAEGAYHALEYAKKSPGTVFVQASTSEVYGDPLIHPQTEDYWGNVNPVGVRSCYDEAKRYAEALAIFYAREHEVQVRIARIFNTYGPHMEKNDGRVISNFITQALAEEPITIYGDGKQTRSFCYVSDMVEGLHAFATSQTCANGTIINMGNPTEKTIEEMAHLIKKKTQTSSKIVYEPIDEDDPKKRKPDITKARNLLSWEPRIPIEEGLEKTITYFRSLIS